jgi:hypothetical protein
MLVKENPSVLVCACGTRPVATKHPTATRERCRRGDGLIFWQG